MEEVGGFLDGCVGALPQNRGKKEGEKKTSPAGEGLSPNRSLQGKKKEIIAEDRSQMT